MKKIIFTSLITMILTFGAMWVIAATYEDTTPTEQVEENKVIKKEWSVTQTKNFSLGESQTGLTMQRDRIDSEIKIYNDIIDEMAEAKAALSLSIEIPDKLEVSTIK